MPTQDIKHSILLLDDRELPRETLARLLRAENFVVETADSVGKACERLEKGLRPTFLFTDRQFPNENVEDRALPEFKRIAPDSLIVVFTREEELSRHDYYAIRAAGAVRVLDRKTMGEQIDDIKAVTDEIAELLELRSALKQATKSRDILLAAVAGADVGLTIVDRHNHVWFANEAQERIVGGSCSGGLCWNLFDGHPPEMGRCWACGVCQVFKTGKTVERVILTRVKSGRTLWVLIQTTPIYGRDGITIIAAREAVSPHTEEIVANMERKNRLLAIAQGLLHVGFGRVRIYEADLKPNSEMANRKLCVAASYKDIPCLEGVDGAYGQSLANMTLNLKECRYCMKAITDWKGLLIREWDAQGPSSISKSLGIEPPYFAVPIWSPKGDTLIGFLGADFVGMDEERRKCTIDYLAKDETLDWLRESVGLEVRNALLGAVAESPEALERYKVVQRAELEVGAAESVDAATAALARAFVAVLPDGCIVSARRMEGDSLLAEKGLCSPTTGIEIPKVVALADSQSLAAYVVNTHRRALWLDDYPQYREKAIEDSRPPGLSPESTKSAAHIPISFEGTIYGSLSIDSPNPIRWHEDGLDEPLMRLTSLTALVVREIRLHVGLDKAKANNAALIAFAAGTTNDAIWKHWAIQKLQAQSAKAATIFGVVEALSQPLSPDELDRVRSALEKVGRSIDDLVRKIKLGYPPDSDLHPAKYSIDELLLELQDSYKEKGVCFPRHACGQTVALPPSVFRRMICFLVDNAIEAFKGPGPLPEINIQCEVQEEFLLINITDYGPNGTNLRRFGVPVAMLDFFELMPVFGEKLVVFRSSFSCSWFASVGS